MIFARDDIWSCLTLIVTEMLCSERYWNVKTMGDFTSLSYNQRAVDRVVTSFPV